MVGGEGFEPSYSRSRTVSAAGPTSSSRTRHAPTEFKSRRLRVRSLPLMTARCRECVTRLASRSAYKDEHPQPLPIEDYRPSNLSTSLSFLSCLVRRLLGPQIYR
jgi:hypothetical protein